MAKVEKFARLSMRMNAVALGQAQTKFSPLDWLLYAIITFPLLGTFFPLITYVNTRAGAVAAAAETSRDATVVLALILLLIIYLFAKEMPATLVALKRNWLLFLFIVWAMITSRWAELPGLSFNRSARILIFALYAIYLMEFVETRKARRILFYAFLTSLMLSLFVIGAMPSLARAADSRGVLGTWRGAMGHKNSLGTLSALSILYAGVMWKTAMVPPRHCLLLAVVASLTLILANSVTAIISTLAMSGLLIYFFYLMPMARDRLLALVLAIGFGVLMLLVIQVVGSVLELFGRDSTLTGRSQVWDFARMMIAQRPFWGFGHGAWGMPVFSKIVLAELIWPSPHAHNFWLDLRLQLGLPGLVLGGLMWAVAGLNALYLLLHRQMSDIAFPIVALILFGIRSYSETIILDPAIADSFYFALVFSVLAKLASEEKSRRRRVRPRAAFASPAVRRFGAGDPAS